MTKDKKVIFALLLALFFMAFGSFLIHLRIHPKIAWLPYLMLFDAIVITILFYFKKTSVFAFFINSIFVIIGAGFHLKYLPGGWADIAISLTDLLAGYAVYLLVTKESQNDNP